MGDRLVLTYAFRGTPANAYLGLEQAGAGLSWSSGATLTNGHLAVQAPGVGVGGRPGPRALGAKKRRLGLRTHADLYRPCGVASSASHQSIAS